MRTGTEAMLRSARRVCPPPFDSFLNFLWVAILFGRQAAAVSPAAPRMPFPAAAGHACVHRACSRHIPP